MPEISNAQAKIAELENALAAASGTVAAMRADVATARNDTLREAAAICRREYTLEQESIASRMYPVRANVDSIADELLALIDEEPTP